MCKFCEGCCACHICPPCTFCVTHTECDLCGQTVCLDKTHDCVEMVICPDCMEARADESAE